MAKSTTTEETANVVTDSAEVNEPTKHTFPTAQEPSQSDYVIATDELFVAGVRAHNVGDRVPTANVERNGWADKVKPA